MTSTMHMFAANTWRAVRGAVVAAVVLLGLLGPVHRAPAAAQFGRLSPHETTKATIDGADVEIVYGRPSMRGRRIMGSLVPYGRVWTPGADEVTHLKTSKKIRVGDLELPAESYAIWMLPTANMWTLILNSDWR